MSLAFKVAKPEEEEGGSPGGWTLATVAKSLAVFVLAGLFEIGGGWLVWQTVREKRPFWLAILGSLVLVGYGFVPSGLMPDTPSSDFGRVFAVYGGVFIVMSYAWGNVVDGLALDVGDYVGGCVALAGVATAWFWPRSSAG
ncbi:hypothetical protein BSKO_08941 [Bryopsis sp. KO-2023]|nr:hypothetical protein BSKO_08941 [Bryopsis sp. KO-2023]